MENRAIMESNVKVRTKKNTKKAKKASTHRTKTIITVLIITVLVLGAAYAGLRLVMQNREEARQSIINSGTFHNGISVNGISIGGMTMEQAKEALSSIETSLTSDIMLTLKCDDSTFIASAGNLGIVPNTDETLNSAILLGREGSLDDLQTEIADIAENGRKYTLSLTVDANALNKYIDHLATQLESEPTNASFKIKELPMSSNKDINAVDAVNIGLPEDGSITDLRDIRFDFTEEKDGIKIEREAFLDGIEQRVENNNFSELEIPVTRTPASVTIASIKEKLVLRSSASTSYSKGHYGRKERVHNMTKATAMIYGTVIQPGEQFSANGTLGYRTIGSGWQPAPAVIDGGAANEDQPGGGVCQISSTMYQAVLKADYKIDYRQGHSSKLGYVDGGLDATIDSGRIDFTWTNNTASAVYIFTWIDKENKNIWCELYGEPFGDAFDEIVLISREQDPIRPTETQYIESPSLTAPYWKLKNASKTGYVFNTYKSYLKDGEEVDRQFITKTTYNMHPTRYYVWVGYAGEELLPEFELKDE